MVLFLFKLEHTGCFYAEACSGAKQEADGQRSRLQGHVKATKFIGCEVQVKRSKVVRESSVLQRPQVKRGELVCDAPVLQWTQVERREEGCGSPVL